jgi:hypothetical protein
LRKRTPAPRKPGQGEIAERAYFIKLDEGRWDGLGHWLRAVADDCCSSNSGVSLATRGPPAFRA